MVWLGLYILATVIYFVITDIHLMKKGLHLIPRKDIYRAILVTQWSMVAGLLILWALIDIPFQKLFVIDVEIAANGFLHNADMLIGLFTGALVAMLILPLLLNSKKPNPAFEKIDFMLPKTLKQRLVFFFIAITAGVCEEIIFRGAATYFFMHLPFDLPMWAVGVCGAALFGLAHWYQGVSGIITSGILGFVLFNVYVITGSLLLPIIIHFLIDVKFVFMPDWKKGEHDGVEV